jgi:tagatose 1,6-diphosphate aldolase
MPSDPRQHFLNLGPGKLMGLSRVADASGRFKVLALDQTGIFRKAFGGDAARIGMAKLRLTTVLGPYASSVLLDVTTSARQAINAGALPRHVGLVVRLEKACGPGDSGVEEPGWEVSKIKRMGADAVKLLVYMDVEDEKYVQGQLEFVKRASEACREHDILLMTEELSFPRLNASEPDNRAPAYQERRVKNILRATELLGPYTEVLKLEFPGPRHLAELNQAAERPWVLLSAGVDFDLFEEQVEAAMRAGASGIMAGRAIFKEWLDPESPHFQSDAFLNREAAGRIQKLASIVERVAASWLDRYSISHHDLASSIPPRWYSPLAADSQGQAGKLPEVT